MTDDKGAGDGAVNNPYEHEDCDSDFGGCGDKCKRGAYEDGYTAGRKAERERCISIVEAVMCVEDDLINGIGKGIVEIIKRGGQDGE